MDGAVQQNGRWLIGLCISRASGGLIFMTVAATMTTLQGAWGISAAQGGAIISGFNLGYAVSLVWLSSLADRVGAKKVFLASMSASGLLAVAFALFAHGYLAALVSYSLLGLAMGGSYTTGLMILADLYPVQKRGRVMGAFIASTSLGYTLSLTICGLALSVGGYALAFWLTALGPVLGAAAAWAALWGAPAMRHPDEPGLGLARELLGNKKALLLIGGYTLHSWELLGMWAWSPAFIVACLAAGGTGSAAAASRGSMLAGLFHLMGLAASFTAGLISDRLGRTRVLVAAAAAGAAASFVFGWSLFLPFWLVMALGMAYAFLVLSDSPVLSAALSEAVRPRRLGTAFGLRSLLGFGAGALSPIVFGAILDALGQSAAGWGLAFGMLGLGGLGAMSCAVAYGRSRGE
ncbi:MAG: MFS transporter [Desulfarculus sp.]|nr:MAG: MFS transporter [Desulfarculus sp.]